MKKITLYSFIIFIFTSYSCSDFLVQEPDVQVSINEQLSTQDGVLSSLNGIYRSIEALLSSREIVYADLQGGNLEFTPSTSVNNRTVTAPDYVENSYEFSDQAQESEYGNFYGELYDIINQVNVILERFNNYNFFTAEEQNQLRAELLTMRAFLHYQVAIHYAQHYSFTSDGSHLGIVYNIQPLIAGIDFPSRATMSETYNLIQSDLDLALSLYTSNQALPGITTSYFNATSTQALCARIALQMDDWETALDYANTVVSTSGIQLMAKDNYISEWELDEDPVSEIILEFTAPRTSEGNVSQSISQWFIYNTNINYGAFVASGDLINLYDINDIRRNMFLEINLTTLQNGIDVELPYFFTKKFQGNAGTNFIRLSEMYLIRAEANARLNNITAALNDLNEIRTRAGLDEITADANILEEIFTERRRELAFEGHLLFDIARFKKDIVRNLGCIASTCNLGYPSNFFILPIPESSTELNENIQQNEGY